MEWNAELQSILYLINQVLYAQIAVPYRTEL